MANLIYYGKINRQFWGKIIRQFWGKIIRQSTTNTPKTLGLQFVTWGGAVILLIK